MKTQLRSSQQPSPSSQSQSKRIPEVSEYFATLCHFKVCPQQFSFLVRSPSEQAWNNHDMGSKVKYTTPLNFELRIPKDPISVSVQELRRSDETLQV
eukprot:IDg3312t1